MQTAYAEVECPAFVPCTPAQEQEHLVTYAPLVKRAVRQLTSQAGAAMDVEDMQQVGLIGLLDALRRYGPPDAGFGPYAKLKVRGAILDELRRQDWRPRAVRQESHKVRDGVSALMRKLGREPTQAEIRDQLGLTAQGYQDYQLAQNAEAMSNFDELLHEPQQHASDSHNSPEAQLTARRSIEYALMGLSEREQRVVQLYYEFDLSLKEIAGVLELTEARICQINKGALKKMKELLR